MSKKDLEKEINILEHEIFIDEIFIERVLTRAMGKNTISLRDHFAGLAMQAMIAADVREVYANGDVAEIAYKQADAMLAEREKRDG
jgi:hypothetical protein